MQTPHISTYVLPTVNNAGGSFLAIALPYLQTHLQSFDVYLELIYFRLHFTTSFTWSKCSCSFSTMVYWPYKVVSQY